jgi:hypothetical protein
MAGILNWELKTGAKKMKDLWELAWHCFVGKTAPSWILADTI